MDEITLYGYATSPYVMKVGCYLQYKKLPFEFVSVNPILPFIIIKNQQINSIIGVSSLHCVAFYTPKLLFQK